MIHRYTVQGLTSEQLSMLKSKIQAHRNSRSLPALNETQVATLTQAFHLHYEQSVLSLDLYLDLIDTLAGLLAEH